ncbi:MAG: UDP-glucose/GDP-mannose dehydrogenase family protein, partial [FCB group bacterium]|nr:UDP-glucose/GDP-mannose dehydrogenase family protein [FCB group bacterium]
IGSYARIGFTIIYPGSGYGGSCVPKDINALIRTADDNGAEPLIIRAISAVNQNQRKVFLARILAFFSKGIAGKTIAVWGLSFKPETDDMREAPSVPVIQRLIKEGAKIQAYDPQAMDEARNHYFKDLVEIQYCSSKYDALNGASALLLLTEWKEFRSPDFDEICKRLDQPVIFDGRNQYSAKMLKDMGISYFQVGVSADQV